MTCEKICQLLQKFALFDGYQLTIIKNINQLCKNKSKIITQINKEICNMKNPSGKKNYRKTAL